MQASLLRVAAVLGADAECRVELKQCLDDLLARFADKKRSNRLREAEWVAKGLVITPLFTLAAGGSGSKAGGPNDNLADLTRGGKSVSSNTAVLVPQLHHEWRTRHFSHPTVCAATLNVNPAGKKVKVCQLCALVVLPAHADTAQGKSQLPCKAVCISVSPTDVASESSSSSSSNRIVQPQHHWTPFPMHRRCHHCMGWIKAKDGSANGGLRCAWCDVCIHGTCKQRYTTHCMLGEYRLEMLPPTCIVASGSMPDVRIERVLPPPLGTHPVIIFINTRSGAGQGERLFRKFRQYVNPLQVFDLIADVGRGGPSRGLELMGKLPNARVIVAGGDGTIGWVLSAMDAYYGNNVETTTTSIPDENQLVVQQQSHQQWQGRQRPPTCVIPVGTGNDLARSLGWGGGYSGEKVGNLLRAFRQADVALLDRWSLGIELADPAAETDKPPLSTINAYFSIGVDASIAHKFHTEREAQPEKFKNRARNKILYGIYGVREQIVKSSADFNRSVEVTVDGVRLDNLPYLEGIAVVNVTNMYAGTNLWGYPAEGSGFKQQHMGDGLVEVIGLVSSAHLAQLKVGLRQSGKRLAQGKQVEIVTRARFPMQTDGEPWMQAPCTVKITHANTVPMMVRGSDMGLMARFARRSTRSRRRRSSAYSTAHMDNLGAGDAIGVVGNGTTSGASIIDSGSNGGGAGSAHHSLTRHQTDGALVPSSLPRRAMSHRRASDPISNHTQLHTVIDGSRLIP